MASVVSTVRRFVRENYAKLQYFLPWSAPFESLNAQTLKRIAVKYGTEINRKQLPIEKRELVKKVRTILTESLLASLLPVIIALFVVFGTIYCAKDSVSRFYRVSIRPYNPFWLLLLISLQLLKYAQVLLSLGVVLSWVQQPISFPRILVDWLLAPLYNHYLFRYCSAGGMNFTPLIIGYVIKQLQVHVQIQLLQTEKYRYSPEIETFHSELDNDVDDIYENESKFGYEYEYYQEMDYDLDYDHRIDQNSLPSETVGPVQDK